MFGMNRHKILKCFRKEKRRLRRAVLSGDRYYSVSILNYLKYLKLFNSLHGGTLIKKDAEFMGLLLSSMTCQSEY